MGKILRRDRDHDTRIRRIEQLSAELTHAVENSRFLAKAVRLSAALKRLLTAKRER
jgi:hypothetical protein